jgi:DnaJ-class molecular chaperone
MKMNEFDVETICQKCNGKGWVLLDGFMRVLHPCPACKGINAGNAPSNYDASTDIEEARMAGWRSIREDEFASGNR